MKYVKTYRSPACPVIAFRFSRRDLSLSVLWPFMLRPLALGWALAIACGLLLVGSPGQAAPVNLLYFPLTNSPGTPFPSSTALGGVSAVLTANNGSGASVNLAGLAGSGVNARGARVR